MIVEALAAVALLVPGSFREATALEPAASYVAGKPVKVWCGVTRIGDVYEGGYTDSVGGNNIFLSPTLYCAPLEKLLSHRFVMSRDAGPAVLALVHEGIHARGVADESVTDCAALKATAQVGILFFGLRGRRRYLRDMMAEAWAQHRARPAAYTRLC